MITRFPTARLAAALWPARWPDRCVGALLVLLYALVALAPLPLGAREYPTPDAPSDDQRTSNPPASLQTGDEVPWLYRGSDVPRDPDWLFGELDNGLRYAVRNNRVPPGQVSIRVRIDAGSLHELKGEEGYAHLMEHLTFRQSRELGPGEAIAAWQRLGATFGSDTNAETSPTHTVYKLDLPAVDQAKLETSFRLLSGMIREPVITPQNVAAEVPIVLAEKRERGGAQQRAGDRTREVLFAGQRLADHLPIGTEEALRAASAETLQAFHGRWYRPENTVIVVVGDADPVAMARAIERWFGDWRVAGPRVEPPDFGDPVAPKGASGNPPIGEVDVVVEPDLPRSLTFAVMRPWRQVNDTIAYNQGLLLDAIAQAILNRRLEARARAGGKFLFAQVAQDDVSRSADATFVTLAPLGSDWRGALAEVRAIIAGALARPPSEEEIAREYAEFEIAFKSELEQKSVIASSKLADQLVNAVDIRETVAAPETVLNVLRAMKPRFNPQEVFEHSRALFEGAVLRAVYITPAEGEASAEALRAALAQSVAPEEEARADNKAPSFDQLPAIGTPGELVSAAPIGVLEIERLEFENGVRALIWPSDAEPGRVNVTVRFGAGYEAFEPRETPYIALGRMALVSSGVGPLGQDDLDRISAGRKLGFSFAIEEASFEFSAQTRREDLADQLYLFAAKLAMPRWDEAPVERAKAAARLAYDSYATSPAGILSRDLDYRLKDRDPRYRAPDPALLEQASAAGFRAFWEPALATGPVEVLVFGDFDREEGIAALARSFGALKPRAPLDPAILARRAPTAFPAPSDTPSVVYHRGDANQAAAVIAWPTGGGVEGLSESRQLEILVQLFSNRLLDAMREKAGASYAPQAYSDWPVDLGAGGTITALAQMTPRDVPIFFAEAERIARDLASQGPSADELERVTEPLRQLISRASTGNSFWMMQLKGASFDPRRIAKLRSLLPDYTRTDAARMKALAQKYLAARAPFRLAVLPQGAAPDSAAAAAPAALHETR